MVVVEKFVPLVKTVPCGQRKRKRGTDFAPVQFKNELPNHSNIGRSNVVSISRLIVVVHVCVNKCKSDYHDFSTKVQCNSRSTNSFQITLHAVDTCGPNELLAEGMVEKYSRFGTSR